MYAIRSYYATIGLWVIYQAIKNRSVSLNSNPHLKNFCKKDTQSDIVEDEIRHNNSVQEKTILNLGFKSLSYNFV